MSRVLSYVNERDFRLNDRLLEWVPPRWFRLWMIGASRLGDGWLWGAIGILLAGSRSSLGLRTLAAAAVAVALANLAQILLKRRFPRPRPCDIVRHRSFDVRPLALFKADCFSFPSGHTLNAFAAATVVALSYPEAAPAGMVVAVSIGASRVVLGLHFLSDVLAGAFLGLALGAAAHAVVFA